MMLYFLIALLIFGTSIWVFFDAERHRVSVSRGRPYSINTGAWAWLGTCVLLWIVGFPYYLVRRSETIHTRT